MFKIFGKRSARPVRDNRRSAHNTEPSPEARNTAEKINAIECEMAAEFNAASRLTPSPEERLPNTPQGCDVADATSTATLQKAIEEAAILHASEQSDIALQLLLDVTQAKTSQSVGAMSQVRQEQEQLAWRIVFDLCQLENLQQQFEQLALVYASRFETSPPQWNPRLTQDSGQEINPPAPSISIRGTLSANSLPLLERIQNLAGAEAALCLECSGVTDVDIQGCAHFLHMLRQIAPKIQQLSLVGASGLLEKIRTLIEPGRRDENDAGWLLQIELLRLMNKEKEHEEVCLEYCVTYEVSPPAFVPPSGFTRLADLPGRYFYLPRVITAPLDPLWEAINRHTANAKILVLDASQLARIDFTVAAPLIEGLLQLHARKPVELRNTHVVVFVLLQLVGGKDKLPILVRKF